MLPLYRKRLALLHAAAAKVSRLALKEKLLFLLPLLPGDPSSKSRAGGRGGLGARGGVKFEYNDINEAACRARRFCSGGLFLSV